MSFEEDDNSFKHTLLIVCEVSVFKIPLAPPPAVTSAASGSSPTRSGSGGCASSLAKTAAGSDSNVD
ncbi:hypothetical protein ACET3Z_011854 [Daucus carota]